MTTPSSYSTHTLPVGPSTACQSWPRGRPDKVSIVLSGWIPKTASTPCRCTATVSTSKRFCVSSCACEHKETHVHQEKMWLPHLPRKCQMFALISRAVLRRPHETQKVSNSTRVKPCHTWPRDCANTPRSAAFIVCGRSCGEPLLSPRGETTATLPAATFETSTGLLGLLLSQTKSTVRDKKIT